MAVQYKRTYNLTKNILSWSLPLHPAFIYFISTHSLPAPSLISVCSGLNMNLIAEPLRKQTCYNKTGVHTTLPLPHSNVLNRTALYLHKLVARRRAE